MKIDAYRFGKVVIEGRTYEKDVIVFPDRVEAEWWRKEGHSLCPEDLATVAAFSPRTVIVGCGMYGALRIPEATRRWLVDQGMELKAEMSEAAVRSYNDAQDRAGTVLCLHLTC